MVGAGRRVWIWRANVRKQLPSFTCRIHQSCIRTSNLRIFWWSNPLCQLLNRNSNQTPANPNVEGCLRRLRLRRWPPNRTLSLIIKSSEDTLRPTHLPEMHRVSTRKKVAPTRKRDCQKDLVTHYGSEDRGIKSGKESGRRSGKSGGKSLRFASATLGPR